MLIVGDIKKLMQSIAWSLYWFVLVQGGPADVVLILHNDVNVMVAVPLVGKIEECKAAV